MPNPACYTLEISMPQRAKNEHANLDQAPVELLHPPLKWAGGKRWQLSFVREFWVRHTHRRLVEPFCGGLAIALGLQPQRALLNDVNPHLINFYKWLRKGLVITMPMSYAEARYYTYRRRFNALLAEGKADSAEAASLFYYLNRTGYNGLCRFNQRGEFNVPFGRYKRINYRVDFLEFKATFAGWDFSNCDFADLPIVEEDFIYADPPYDVDFTEYSSGGFDWNAQVRAAQWLAEHPGPVILSNQATQRIVELYRDLGYTTRILEAPRRISCNGDRRPALEVLALRNI